ncbi:MAG TPA: aminoacyl-tRNA hydrolase [Chloroflexota bacterium]|jgi:PTH1 family peptidyl-tRNA hydrolase|nr:aminoacyl-tRNA hydrolase [Chloroflexota bacterium]
MKAIVGLGNPGPRYRNTRHNAGWHVLDELHRRWNGGKPVQSRHAEVIKTAIAGDPVLLVKPQTFMNDSGKSVRGLVEKDGIDPDGVLVVYDDLDLAVGRIRIRARGSSGGHRGIKSIQEHLKAVGRLKRRPPVEAGGPPGEPAADPLAFPRLKVGIGRPPAGVDPIDFVLTTFAPDELALIKPAVERAADAVECWMAEGADVAANRFNGG